MEPYTTGVKNYTTDNYDAKININHIADRNQYWDTNSDDDNYDGPEPTDNYTVTEDSKETNQPESGLSNYSSDDTNDNM